MKHTELENLVGMIKSAQRVLVDYPMADALRHDLELLYKNLREEGRKRGEEYLEFLWREIGQNSGKSFLNQRQLKLLCTLLEKEDAASIYAYLTTTLKHNDALEMVYTLDDDTYTLYSLEEIPKNTDENRIRTWIRVRPTDF